MPDDLLDALAAAGEDEEAEQARWRAMAEGMPGRFLPAMEWLARHPGATTGEVAGGIDADRYRAQSILRQAQARQLVRRERKAEGKPWRWFVISAGAQQADLMRQLEAQVERRVAARINRLARAEDGTWLSGGDFVQKLGLWLAERGADPREPDERPGCHEDCTWPAGAHTDWCILPSDVPPDQRAVLGPAPLKETVWAVITYPEGLDSRYALVNVEVHASRTGPADETRQEVFECEVDGETVLAWTRGLGWTTGRDR